MTPLPSYIALRPSLPESTMRGYDATDHLILVLAGWPQSEPVLGHEEDAARVVRWEVGKASWRRLSAIALWASMGHGVAGRA